MPEQLAARPVSTQAIAAIASIPLGHWHFNAHRVCLDVVRSGYFPYARVVEGSARGVSGAHYWISLSEDVYDKYGTIVDPTLWCHSPSLTGVWIGTLLDEVHHPAGEGYIWDHDYPENSSFREAVTLNKEGLSAQAKIFLSRIEPINLDGWRRLMGSPMQGWPAGEIIDQMKHTPELSPLVPEALEGMLTNRNPNGAWLA